MAVACMPVGSPAADITKNLIAHYTLDDKTGSTALDASGRKHHGTLHGYDSDASGWSNGQLGGALSFDGDNDYVSISHHNDFDLKTYTLAAWVKVSSGNEIRPILVKGKFDDGLNSTDVSYALYLSSAQKLTLAYEKSASSQKLAENMSYVATGARLNPGETYHVAVTRKHAGGGITFYVNGQSGGGFENTPAPGDNNQKLYLGLDLKTNKVFKGGLDDVRIYSRSLDASDILALFQLGSVNEEASTGSARTNDRTTRSETTNDDKKVSDSGEKEVGNETHSSVLTENIVTESQEKLQDNYEEDTSSEKGRKESSRGTEDKTEVEPDQKGGKQEDQTFNHSPNKILLSRKSIYEGQKIGTTIGQLTVIDPDDPEGKGTYALELILPESSSRKVKFTVSENSSNDQVSDTPFELGRKGVLRSKEILDHETRDSYTIRIKATDEEGLYVESDFVIRVEDAFLPIVRTENVSEAKSGRFEILGKIVADGHSTIQEVGLVLSKQPRFEMNDKDTSIVSAKKVSQLFQVSLPRLEAETTYHFRTYAKNPEGTGYGSLDSFTTPKSNDGPWAKTNPIGNGWLHLDWLGNLYPTDSGWVYHEELGWVYAKKSEEDGLWFYSKDFLGWFWTGPKVYPFVYTDASKAWVYYQGTMSNHRVFYHFGRKSWMTIPRNDSTQRQESKKTKGKTSEKAKSSSKARTSEKIVAPEKRNSEK
ncbi:MAG: LamG-like jellyroll fold domain-containing protein [Opitutales bacterium]